ncbi:MFS transporter [Pseudomonas oryzihabitans]|nr:MFS transporter [Pseudomonas psychrotolerans]
MAQALPTSSVPTTAQSVAGPSRAKLIVAASLGNGLEMFDFTVFSFFAAIIGQLYFPSDTPYGSLLMAVGVFGVGFVMRPLGSMVLGAYADRHGRKQAMLLTISLMGLGSALIAFTPTHAQIGLAAPLILLLGRLLQGFSAGGEIGAATTLLLESASPGRRGLHVSWQVISQGGSALLGAGLGALLTRSLSEADLHAWGWRIPFLVGLAIIPVGLYIRRQVDETWSGAGAPEGGPVRAFLREHPRRFGLGLLIVMSATLLTYLMQFYMPTYMTRIVGLPATSAYLAGVASSAVQMAAALAAGLLLDRYGRYKPVTLVSLAVAVLGIYPAFVWLNDPTTQGLAFAARFVVITAMSVNMTAGLLLILAGLPRPVRATGLAMTYALAVTLFGGTAQFIATWLIQASGSPLAPAWYLIAMLLIGWVALLSYPERHLD